MISKDIDEKMLVLKDAEKIVEQIYNAWENPTNAISGDAARIWNTIKNWNMDIDNKLMKKENKGYFTSMVAMMLSVEKETIKMCIVSIGKSHRKGSKWDTIVSKFSKNSSLI